MNTELKEIAQSLKELVEDMKYLVKEVEGVKQKKEKKEESYRQLFEAMQGLYNEKPIHISRVKPTKEEKQIAFGRCKAFLENMRVNGLVKVEEDYVKAENIFYKLYERIINNK